MAAPESLGPQFPVVRRTSHYVTQDAGVQRTQVYTAIHPETGKAVGTVGIEYPSVAPMSGREIDKAFKEAEPGTDVPMFKFFPERVDALAVDPSVRGQGVGKSLLNNVIGDLMAAEGRGTARIPNLSSNLSPDAAGMATKYTGSSMEKDQYWTDSGAAERGEGESEEDYAKRMNAWRRKEMDDFATETLGQRKVEESVWRPGAEPGEMLGGNPVHKIEMAPDQTTTLDEKVAAMPKSAKKGKKGRSLPVAGQLPLPGI
jgi:hypothetical protein